MLPQRGQYAYMRVRYGPNGRVDCAPAAAAPAGLPLADPAYDPGVSIGRIVVLGLADPLWTWGGAVLHADTGKFKRHLFDIPGPLWVREGLPEAGLVARKPDLPASGTWALAYSRATPM